MYYLAPEYVYTPHGLQRDMLIAVGDDGHIAAVVEAAEHVSTNVQVLSGVALLPGFVNTHSHVFQRALRGHTHRRIAQHDSFWSWREAMYAEAQRLDPDSFYEEARQTYREMLAAGYTTVGEFHYLHHQPGGQAYADTNAMADAVLAAGHDAGMRVVLLMVAYEQSGFGQPATVEQRRFCDRSVEAYLQRIDALRIRGVSIGVAPHSVRAVSEQWFRAIASYSHIYGLPLHVHADEQREEVAQCVAYYGCTPIELLERWEVLGSRTTIVHATHASDTELALLAKYGCTVCVCPTTEADLGDGIAPYDQFMASDILLSIGSDSNTRFDPIEELRWAEYSARMRYQRRRILVCEKQESPGSLLLDIGTRGGAVALGLETGVIVPGMTADFVAIDLKHPSLRGWTPRDLLDTLFFGTSSEVVRGVWVQGRQVV